MSITDPSRSDDAESVAFPSFELEYAFDDASEPTEVTLFSTSGEDDPVTNWLTVDVDHAVPLEEVR
ncbi:hypothetical protein ACFQE1_09305 [Halobium palmae]|uniref:DUF7511 domain-containing protein n=1 Tax=Halobium palmae TaxID=1776492 RepID=A0ABD5RZ25_9EURY